MKLTSIKIILVCKSLTLAAQARFCFWTPHHLPCPHLPLSCCRPQEGESCGPAFDCPLHFIGELGCNAKLLRRVLMKRFADAILSSVFVNYMMGLTCCRDHIALKQQLTYAVRVSPLPRALFPFHPKTISIVVLSLISETLFTYQSSRSLQPWPKISNLTLHDQMIVYKITTQFLSISYCMLKFMNLHSCWFFAPL